MGFICSYFNKSTIYNCISIFVELRKQSGNKLLCTTFIRFVRLSLIATTNYVKWIGRVISSAGEFTSNKYISTFQFFFYRILISSKKWGTMSWKIEFCLRTCYFICDTEYFGMKWGEINTASKCDKIIFRLISKRRQPKESIKNLPLKYQWQILHIILKLISYEINFLCFRNL